jgi:hypothetical protein
VNIRQNCRDCPNGSAARLIFRLKRTRIDFGYSQLKIVRVKKGNVPPVEKKKHGAKRKSFSQSFPYSLGKDGGISIMPGGLPARGPG